MSTTWFQSLSFCISISLYLSLTSSIGSRGKAVHLLSAAMASKKRKKPERNQVKVPLPVSLIGGSSGSNSVRGGGSGGAGMNAAGGGGASSLLQKHSTGTMIQASKAPSILGGGSAAVGKH
jgi:hypothetical protein